MSTARTLSNLKAFLSYSFLIFTNCLNDGYEMLGDSHAIKEVMATVRRIAPYDVTVLITGETGTGKELVARKIHQYSARRGGNFTALNCAAIPNELVESELFGHEKGSFTSAYDFKRGILERANNGTLFLDEVNKMTPTAQAKVLRVFEDGTFMRVGATSETRANLRVVSAANGEIHSGNGFNEGLYYRLSATRIKIPPLRERPGDISYLAYVYLDKLCKKHGEKTYHPEVLGILERYNFPGNVRELINIVEHGYFMSRNDKISPDIILERIADESGARQSSKEDTAAKPVTWREGKMKSYEELLVDALKKTRGNMSAAAALVKTSRSSVQNFLRDTGYTPSSFCEHHGICQRRH